MRISSVKIKNFRSLRSVDIHFDSVTTFIGPNGTGKSTVLRALDWFFNGSKQGDLTDKDCSHGVVDEDIEVQVTFEGLTDSDREALGKYAVDGVDSFTAWKKRTPSGEETLSANAKGYPEFTPIKNETGATQKKALYAAVRTSKPELGLPAASTGAAVDEAMVAWEAANVDLLEDVPEVATNFFGFNSNGKMSGLFDFVFVAADMRASEESIDAKSSIIGRILERSVDRSAADDAIAAIVEESRRKQQAVYRDKFGDQLASMSQSLNEVVGSYSPGRTVDVRAAEVDLKAGRTTFNVAVLDGENETAVERQGHGFQRALLISALQHLAQSAAAATEGVICLAIEEPELFQHPIQAQVFARVLRTLAEDDEKRIQVTYATHSPYFVEARHFDQVRRLTRSTGGSPEVKIHSSTLVDIKTALTGIIKPTSVESQLDGTVSNRLSMALFSSRVLLVEGTTDEAVFYGIGDRDSVAKLEASGTSIVQAGGKMNIPLAHAILDAIGIPVYAVFDADSGQEARSVAAGRDAQKVADEKAATVAANRKLAKYFGLTVVDFPDEQVNESVAVFGDHLEAYLVGNWGEWNDAAAQLESETGVELRKNQDAYRTVTARAAGDAPTILASILEKIENL